MAEHLRQVIRSILMEELARHGIGSSPNTAPAARVEEVEINSDADLAKFVRRLLQLSRNAGAVSDIESGRHVFRLRAGGSAERHVRPPADRGRSRGGVTMTLDKGLVTEKQVRNLPDDISVVRIGNGVRLTPLASDALRRSGIKIEKVKS